jgi:hypothetical protein
MTVKPLNGCPLSADCPLLCLFWVVLIVNHETMKKVCYTLSFKKDDVI